MENLVDIDARLIFLVLNGEVSMVLRRSLSRDFQNAGLDLKPEQWNVLQCLSRCDGLSQQELCKVMLKDRPGMARVIDSMVSLGLVTRTVNRFDRRKNIIRLTEKGERTQSAAIKVSLLTLRKALRGLSLSDILTAQEVLRKMLDNTARVLGYEYTPVPQERMAYE